MGFVTRVGVLIITDGRPDYLARMLDSLKLTGCVEYGPVVVVDDSADPAHWRVVDRLMDHADVGQWMAPWHLRHEVRMGLAGAVRTGWAAMLQSPVDYVFHVEEDFLFPEPPPVEAMVALLADEPELAQVVLKRQPWSPQEMAAGGIMELVPDAYTPRAGYVEHTRVFSLNPCVYTRDIMLRGWPDTNESGMTEDLVAAGFRFAFYGARDDDPLCIHIGARRSAAWKL